MYLKITLLQISPKTNLDIRSTARGNAKVSNFYKIQ